MTLSLDPPFTDLSNSFAGLEMDSQDGVASTLVEQVSIARLTRSTQGDVGQKTGFLALPREIRDQVYFKLVVAADPVQYDKDFKTLSRSDTFTATALMWMFEEGSNPKIARETREAFYQHNSFLIYTHDIPVLLEAKDHVMLFETVEGTEPRIYSAPFEASAYVRKLAVRVGWHTTGGWFPDCCCIGPANDLRLLLDWDSLRSVIIDARFGAWSYGYPQGIGWDLLEEMNERWGTEFRIYNDQMLSEDTRRYTSDRNDLSIRWLPQEIEQAKARRIGIEQTEVNEDEEVDFWGNAETIAEDEDEDEAEDKEEGEDESEGTEIYEDEDEEEGWSGEEAHVRELNASESVDDRSW